MSSDRERRSSAASVANAMAREALRMPVELARLPLELTKLGLEFARLPLHAVQRAFAIGESMRRGYGEMAQHSLSLVEKLTRSEKPIPAPAGRAETTPAPSVEPTAPAPPTRPARPTEAPAPEPVPEPEAEAGPDAGSASDVAPGPDLALGAAELDAAQGALETDTDGVQTPAEPATDLAAPADTAGEAAPAQVAEVIDAAEVIARAAAEAERQLPTETVARGDLPVSDFDHLTVGSLRGRLRTLPLDDLRTLRDYEREHAHRLPILTLLENRIAKLEAAVE